MTKGVENVRVRRVGWTGTCGKCVWMDTRSAQGWENCKAGNARRNGMDIVWGGREGRGGEWGLPRKVYGAGKMIVGKVVAGPGVDDQGARQVDQVSGDERHR